MGWTKHQDKAPDVVHVECKCLVGHTEFTQTPDAVVGDVQMTNQGELKASDVGSLTQDRQNKASHQKDS